MVYYVVYKYKYTNYLLNTFWGQRQLHSEMKQLISFQSLASISCYNRSNTCICYSLGTTVCNAQVQKRRALIFQICHNKGNLHLLQSNLLKKQNPIKKIDINPKMQVCEREYLNRFLVQKLFHSEMKQLVSFQSLASIFCSKRSSACICYSLGTTVCNAQVQKRRALISQICHNKGNPHLLQSNLL